MKMTRKCLFNPLKPGTHTEIEWNKKQKYPQCYKPMHQFFKAITNFSIKSIHYFIQIVNNAAIKDNFVVDTLFFYRRVNTLFKL